ncbi:MEKHLA domain-containing protein [Asticcacaulis sp. AND118]|uniref:MEKHLA domain-containing protein n=1 Tax=Asticcacaulis sp. AND118 TaxID=2840468 RepID=UPI001CFFE0BD|nr:MEKHLA domain-containing protein [Asticcacaulis sp. AND118]UDF02566.1 MEKHLA domain-containing protein [Asticcacaulis sp. AND118]
MPPHLDPAVQAYNRLMANSFRRFTGQDMAGNAGTLTDSELADALFQAPQAIVSHGTEADPVFRYANAQALALWEMEWKAFTRLPSRHSAEGDSGIQSDRNDLLRAALAQGHVDHYTGIRVSASGRRFHIEDTVLWNVVDEAGIRYGQAAFIRRWTFL